MAALLRPNAVPFLSGSAGSDSGGGQELSQVHPDKPVLTPLVACHLGIDPAGLALRRIPTGKFNTSYIVEGGLVPLVLRASPPDDRSRMLFYEHSKKRQEPILHEFPMTLGVRPQSNPDRTGREQSSNPDALHRRPCP